MKSKLGGSNESKISKKHNILLVRSHFCMQLHCVTVHMSMIQGSKAETGKIITKSGKNEHQVS